MANALEAASLVMIPSGYEDGTLGSLKPTDGSGDFTFSRGSNLSATRINEQGYIEKGYENLLLQSNTFDTTWQTISGSITSGQSGYDGTNDAWILDKSSFAGQVKQSISISGVNTLSVYLKAGTLNFVRIITTTGLVSVTIDLSNGVFASVSGGIISKTIESSGNGFYKVSISFAESIGLIGFIPQESSSVLGVSGSIYIQDAMLNQGLVAYPYIETTTAPVAGGVLEDEPRIDFSDGCGHLLLEPSRTNLIPYSEYNFASTNGTIDYNNALSPEGYTNAIKFTSTGTAPHIRIGANQSVSNATISAFVKYGNKQWVQFMLSSVNTLYANFDIQNGVVGDTGASTSNAKIEDYGNGWYRISATFSYIGSTSARIYLVADGSANWASPSSVSGDYIYTYGWQAEQDTTYPTSYIPTYGVSQTRLQEYAGATTSLTDTATLFYHFGKTPLVGNRHFFNLSGVDSYIQIKDSYTALSYRFMFYTNGGFVVDTTINAGDFEEYKFALVFTRTSLNIFVNGTKYSYSFADVGFNFTKAQFFKDYNGNSQSPTTDTKCKQIVLFPTALSDSECIALTTI